MINVPASDILFLSGGTEANNLVIMSAIHSYNKDIKPHVLTSALEHDSILVLLKKLREENIIELDIVPPCPVTFAPLPSNFVQKLQR